MVGDQNMSDWEITSIQEDLGSPDAERWMVVFNVPVEYSWNGVYSYSIPKDVFNTYAAVYDYDITDPQQIEDLFDHIMSIPMLNNVIPTTSEAGAQSLAGKSADVPVSAAMLNPFEHPVDELKATLKAQVAILKGGAAQLKSAAKVTLNIEGMDEEAPAGENPKYILKRDMLARLDPNRVAAHRTAVRDERQAITEQASRRAGLRD